MFISMYGVDYKTVPIELREKLSLTTNNKISITNDLLDLGIKEVVLLSTCNRTEIYIADNKAHALDKIQLVEEYFTKLYKIEFDKIFTKRHGNNAIKHLFRVTSGLDSLVLGEDQILGQVKDSYDFALEIGGSKKVLNKFFLEAITIAKHLKNVHSISERPLSLSYIGVEFLEEKLGSLVDKNVLIVGLGEMGTLVLKNILEKDVKKIYLSNRSHGKIMNFTNESEKIIPMEYEKRYETLEKVDILITATGCPHKIFTYEELKKLDSKLCILDLALPRDVELDSGMIENIEIYNIDHLEKIANDNRKKRKEIAIKMEKEIDIRVNEFIDWKKTIKADSVIKKLHEKCKKIEDDTLKIIHRKSDLGKREKKIVEKMLNSALKRVIREPILNLKNTDSEKALSNYIETLEELFEMN